MSTPLEILRRPFPPKKVGKLPKITCSACSKKQCQDQSHKPKSCTVCGNWITPKHIHLDYVGHAEVTRRLNEADPAWTVTPLALDQNGLPMFDSDGGLWVNLTIHDGDGNEITRLGYGDAGGKSGPNAKKEVIGDAIRNAAMRFGVALDLWSKERDDYTEEAGTPPVARPAKAYGDYLAAIVASRDRAELTKVGQDMAQADIPNDDRTALRAEFTKRMTELKEAK